MLRAADKNKAGEADAVLRELVNEPSGHIADLLPRLGTSPSDVNDVSDVNDALNQAAVTPEPPEASETAQDQPQGAVSAFDRGLRARPRARAPVPDVWAVVADPTQIPEREPGIATIDDADRKTAVGMTGVENATPLMR